MKVSELIDYLYKCSMDAEVKIGWYDNYINTSYDVADVVQVSSRLHEDAGTVYLVQD